MVGLKTRNLKKSFSDTTVIKGISFEVKEGEFCILLGPSGCGKTTIMRLIAGLERQDEGEIIISERDVSDLTPKERDVAMVFQSYALYPHMNVYENMAFSLKIKKVSRQEIDVKVKDTAELLGIGDLLFRKPRELSGGQKQRVAIGRAIVRNPKIFLFDEPLSNLDAKLRATMRVEIAKLHQRLGTTMIYVTHDQVEAMTLGEKIILLDRGVIQQIGTPEDVYKKPANLFVATFIGSPQINLIEGTIVIDKGRLFFKSGELMIALGLKEELKKYEGSNVVMGMRPEALSPGIGPIHGYIEFIEHLGPETILYINGKGEKFVAKAHSDFKGERGKPISLALDNTGVHLFYNGTRMNT